LLPRFRLSSFVRLAVLSVICACAKNNASAQQLKTFDANYLRGPARGPDLEQAANEIFRLTNEFREEHRLHSLQPSRRLHKAAAYFAAYMGRTDRYGHESDGNRPADRVEAYAYDYCLQAENIAYQMKSSGFSTGELAQKFFDGWKNSPPHRENMLNPNFTEVGIVIGYSPKSKRYYAVQELGRPRNAEIRFEVANHTDDTLRYVVSPAGSRDKQAVSFELPPRTRMSHTRCQPSTIDWEWTKYDDRVNAENRVELMVENSERGYHVVRGEVRSASK
jgi:uncharacterized protein YkwD